MELSPWKFNEVREPVRGKATCQVKRELQLLRRRGNKERKGRRKEEREGGREAPWMLGQWDERLDTCQYLALAHPCRRRVTYLVRLQGNCSASNWTELSKNVYAVRLDQNFKRCFGGQRVPSRRGWRSDVLENRLLVSEQSTVAMM